MKQWSLDARSGDHTSRLAECEGRVQLNPRFLVSRPAPGRSRMNVKGKFMQQLQCFLQNEISRSD